MKTVYATRNEAIIRWVVEALTWDREVDPGSEFDVEAIADSVLDFRGGFPWWGFSGCGDGGGVLEHC